jgi:protein-disulfide isomerase
MTLRIVTSIFLTIILSGSLFAQDTFTPLATMTGKSFTIQDLSSETAKAWSGMPETLKKARVDLLDMQIKNILLKQELSKRSLDIDTLLETDVYKKILPPTDARIIEVYEANKARFGTSTLADLRPQIIAYLDNESKREALNNYITNLRNLAKIEKIKDVNAPRLIKKDVLVSINGQSITVAAFEKKNGLSIYEYQANVFDMVESVLKLTVDAAVFKLEAQSLQIPVSELIKREITDKMKVVNLEEQERLESGLKTRLYAKYRVKFFLKEPKPFIQKVSADDDPFIGKAGAPVSVVMFTDYECPACAGVNPIIKKVAAKHGDNVKLVYRDYPLVGTHKFAFDAARAAFAAKNQNKYFEYVEVLYGNQESLGKDKLLEYAKKLGIDMVRFKTDMESEAAAAEIKKDISDGEDYGVAGTPSIFVNGYKIRTLSVQAFEDAIKRALAGRL